MTFADLLVLELASVLAGPSVGQFFAELGATVVKVENPATGGDVTRRWKLPEEDPDADRSAYFAAANWGKRSLALDLTKPDGQAVLHDLARRADVVLASYKPGDAEKLGTDFETLAALNPRLLYAHVVGYDEHDPRPGYDAVIQAESGFTFMNGMPDGPPVKMPVALVDVLAAHQMKEALLVGLIERERTGRGGRVTISLLQAAVSALANQASNYLSAGHVPQRIGSDHPNIAPYGTAFETSDGEAVVLAVGTDRQFAALCGALGAPELARSPQFATNQKRVRNRPFLHHLLAERVATQTQHDLLTALTARGVPAGPVNDLRTVFTQEPAAALALRDPESGLGGVRQVVFGEPPPLEPPPRYGADAAYVLRHLLGYDGATAERLAERGAVAG